MSTSATQRSLSDVYTLTANNTQKQVSPQDLRDVIKTLEPGYGQMYVTSSAATTPDDTASYKDIAGTFSLVSDALNWSMGTNGRLQYDGAADRIVKVSAEVSFISGSSNQVVHFRVAKNGTALAQTEQQRKVGTGSDVGAIAFGGLVPVTNGDYLTIEVRNETSTGTVTCENASLAAEDFAK